ncbi:hypothetical protein PIB30_064825 [Stylosanthes scabra]|uniref:Uncharacterized protein n=1 Tax=Stylosanthes scabra TaxID=79078 RepID=A0ABU6YL97_9FABA|nr:hypothetical protein [Stylosanthes scabra]
MFGRSRGSSQSSRGRGRGCSYHPSTSCSVATASSTDSQQAAPSPQLNADSSHMSQPDPLTQQVVQIPITWDGQKGGVYIARRTERAYPEGLRLLSGEALPVDHAGIRGESFRTFAVNKVNRASSKGGCLHTGGSATIPKTRARMNEFSVNLEQATQQAQEEGDESAGTVHSNVVWRQTLSKPYKNRVYGVGGFFGSSLHRSGYGGSSASASSTHTGSSAPEVVDLREQVQNLTQSLETQWQEALAQRDARVEEHLWRMEEMQRQMAAFYNPLHPGSSTAVGGSGFSTAPPLPPRPPGERPDHPQADDDDDYEDA